MEYHLIVTLPFFLLLHVGLAFTFKKAGESWWKGLVPLYNVWVWLEIVGRPRWWIVLFMIPVLNFVMGIGIILDMLRSFGIHRFRDHVLAVIFPQFYFLYLGFNKSATFKGKWTELAVEHKKSSSGREWLDAILFAGAAALLIRTLLLEAFMIPTTSMEGSLLAGDFLFVSKVHYGVRLPQAPLSFPFVHNTLPFTKGTKSYLDWITLPYSRLPRLKSVHRNEIVVFNYPDDDMHPDVPELGPIKITSMKQNYIKRCVAVAGDTLEIINQQIYINGQKGWNPEHLQFSYITTGFHQKTLEKEGFRTDKNDNNRNAIYEGGEMSTWILHMDAEKMAKLSKIPNTTIQTNIEDLVRDHNTLKNNEDFMMARAPKNALFPKAPSKVLWSRDNFGPLWIPKKGATIQLTEMNLLFYRKAIEVYEDNKLEVKGGKYYINGKETDSYTFEMDYYWMMGDNRHASLDSRYWGFVPEDHIIGRPWFVLFSYEGGPRWNRFFRPITKWEE